MTMKTRDVDLVVTQLEDYANGLHEVLTDNTVDWLREMEMVTWIIETTERLTHLTHRFYDAGRRLQAGIGSAALDLDLDSPSRQEGEEPDGES